MAKETTKTAPEPMLSESEIEELNRDEISKEVGDPVFLFQYRFDWLRTSIGISIDLNRFYPRKNVALDRLTMVPVEEIERRKKLCAENGILYVAINRGDNPETSAAKVKAAIEAREKVGAK